MKRIGSSILLFALLTLSGCANPYSQFYQGEKNARLIPNYIPRVGPIQLYASDDFKRDLDVFARRGYFVVGTSSFNGNSDSVSQGQLLQQAESVGSHIVLVSSKHTGTITGALPVIVPKTSTSYSTGSATAYGTGGSATAYGNSTTTTYSQQTMMMPYTISRSDFHAIYLIKRKVLFGAFWGPIDVATTQRLQTNQALLIGAVVEDTPAYRADILTNDIILQIDGQKVASAEWFSDYLSANQGKTISLLLDRSGTRLEKAVTLNAN